MNKLDENSWVWVVIQDPGGNEQLLGQHDEENDISFIPTFLEKDEALKYEELTEQAFENGFMLFILNGSGELLDKVAPK